MSQLYNHHMDLRLESPVQFVPRVGPNMGGKLRKRLGIETVFDLLTYVPFRYDDFSVISPISRLRAGEIVTVNGTLASIRTFVTKTGKRMVTGRIMDDTGTIDAVWFNQQYLVKVLSAGDRVSLSGKADWFGSKIVLSSPTYEKLPENPDGTSLHTGRVVPVYPETEGISSKWLRGRIHYVLEHCLGQVDDRLPETVREKEHLMPLQDAIRHIHFPPDTETSIRARERLAFDELFTLLIRSYHQRHLRKTTQIAERIPINQSLIAKFLRSLPFSLTGDQERALTEILEDMEKPVPMNRILEGDVGSGKTVVAAGALLAAAASGKHAVLMAPTQILAEQHFASVSRMLAAFDIRTELVTGSTSAKKHKLPKHDAQVLIGTHALLSSDRISANTALVIIDEQQRFGVEQRARLRALTGTGVTPHQMIMTATPIPRTLAQTVFGDLDLSVLTTLPDGRQPVRTWLVPTAKRSAAYTWIEKELASGGGQAFVICPLIEESDSMTTVRAASAEYARLKDRVFPHRRVGLLHGRLKPQEKTDILEKLQSHAIDILVATPVVEVGIDIPNATIILIEAADRFGLSQLHQLRGRVGRGKKSSYCLLFTENETESTVIRLKAMESVHNGPELAELDLTLRGPGDLFGTRQHGVSGLTLARLTDTGLVSRVRGAVERIAAHDPSLSAFAHLRPQEKPGTIDTAHA